MQEARFFASPTYQLPQHQQISTRDVDGVGSIVERYYWIAMREFHQTAFDRLSMPHKGDEQLFNVASFISQSDYNVIINLHTHRQGNVYNG